MTERLIQVRPADDGWVVREMGKTREFRFAVKAEAVMDATKRARTGPASTVVVLTREGTIEQVRDFVEEPPKASPHASAGKSRLMRPDWRKL